MTRFDEFWELCPRKKGKGAARRAWAKAVRSIEPDQIIESMRRFRSECIGKEPEFICHPATWLNQERWDDEPDRVVKPSEEAVWASRAQIIKRPWGKYQYSRDVVEECYRRKLLTREEMEKAL